MPRNTNTLYAGESLTFNEGLLATNGQFTLIFTGSTANLALFEKGKSGVAWASSNKDNRGYAYMHATLQTDGNLVLSAYGQPPYWSSGTHGISGARLVLDDDGTIAVFETMWSARPWPEWQQNPQIGTTEPAAIHRGDALRPGQRLAAATSSR